MTEKVCKLYEEEQVGKVREGRKAVPKSKMPDLGWDVAEPQLQKDHKQVEVQENSEINNPHMTIPIQAMITTATLLITALGHLNSYGQEIAKLTKKMAQMAKSTVTKINNTKVIRNVRKTYREMRQKIRIATRAIDNTNCNNHHS